MTALTVTAKGQITLRRELFAATQQGTKRGRNDRGHCQWLGRANMKITLDANVLLKTQKRKARLLVV